MGLPAQFAFDLVRLPAYGEEDFFVSPCNRKAAGWIERWPDWPDYGLEIVGAPGSGKSHLMRVWQVRSGARVIDMASSEPLPPVDRLFRESPVLGIDNAHRIAGSDRRERWLLHLLNMTREEGGSILVMADGPEARWGLILPDLSSRLAALPVAQIDAPDDVLLAVTLLKQLADLGAEAAPAAIDYMVARMDRSFEEARRMARILNRASLAVKRPITVPLARAVVEHLAETAARK